jgi:hypothetical protein
MLPQDLRLGSAYSGNLAAHLQAKASDGRNSQSKKVEISPKMVEKRPRMVEWSHISPPSPEP